MAQPPPAARRALPPRCSEACSIPCQFQLYTVSPIPAYRNILGLTLGQITQAGPGSADGLTWRRRSDVSLTEEPGKTRRREAPRQSEELYRLLAENSTD